MVEALLRWQHPTLGEIAPGDFIALAEHTELIVPLTKFVLEGYTAVSEGQADYTLLESRAAVGEPVSHKVATPKPPQSYDLCSLTY